MFTSGTIGDGAFESLTSGNVKYSRDALIAHTALNEGCALCAIGKCCGDILSVLPAQAHETRFALHSAVPWKMRPSAGIRQQPRVSPEARGEEKSRKRKSWTVDNAWWFLE